MMQQTSAPANTHIPTRAPCSQLSTNSLAHQEFSNYSDTLPSSCPSTANQLSLLPLPQTENPRSTSQRDWSHESKRAIYTSPPMWNSCIQNPSWIINT